MDVSLVGACVLNALVRDVQTVDGAHLEHVEIEVGTTETCPFVDLQLAPGVELTAVRARVRLSDDTKRKVEGPRLDYLLPERDGSRAVRFHTPDLVPGDVLLVEADRRWSAPWTWDGTAFATEVVAPPISGPSAVALRQELVVPGDFQRTLYPGGGSSLRTTWTVSFDASPDEKRFVVPVPRDATEVQVDGTHVRLEAGVLLVSPADQAQEHAVRFLTPDAPTHGVKAHIDGVDVEHTVLVEAPDGGRIRWEDDQTWWLASIGMRAVLPDRPQLVQALENRFRRAAIPEPALPWSLRATPVDLELAAKLAPILRDRSGIGELPLDPLFPRKLVKARRSGALTSGEAALILALQLQQARFGASWALARPASEGRGFHTSPSGYRVGLTVFEHGGQIFWIDPSCRVCAPFELHPDLEGADVLSPVTERTPGPREGAMRVSDAERERTVVLEGPAALWLRLELSALIPDTRTPWLAGRFGGPGSTLVRAEGVYDPGAPITVVVTLTDGSPDPLAPVEGSWWGWVGERVWQRSRQPTDADRHVHHGPLCWTARTESTLSPDGAGESGLVTERLIVSDRAVPGDASAALAEGRARDISQPE